MQQQQRHNCFKKTTDMPDLLDVPSLYHIVLIFHIIQRNCSYFLFRTSGKSLEDVFRVEMSHNVESEPQNEECPRQWTTIAW